MKNETYKYTVISRQTKLRVLSPHNFFLGDVTIVHKRTNWWFWAKVWAWVLQTKSTNAFVVNGHVETAFKDNQP